jgi:hypothetical protein
VANSPFPQAAEVGTAGGASAYRHETLAILEKLSATGQLPQEQLAIAVRLLNSVGPTRKSPGTVAGTLLVLSGWSVGSILTLRKAAEAVQAVGGSATREGIRRGIEYYQQQLQVTCTTARMILIHVPQHA